MYIARTVDQGGVSEAIKRVSFCLDQLEKYGFKTGYALDTHIATKLTLEEMVGALVSAEQELREEKE